MSSTVTAPPSPPPAPPSAPVFARAWTAATAAVAVAGAVLLLPLLVGPYTLHSFSRIVAVGLLAASVAVLAGHAHLPSLGQVAPYAIGAYATGILAKAGTTHALLLLAAAAVLAAGFSLLTGLAVVRTRGTVFLMVTLAVGQLTVTAIEAQREVSGGSDGLVAIPAATLGPLTMIQPRHTYWYAAVVAAVVLAAAWWLLWHTPAGMLLRGVRDHETRQATSGHYPHRILLAAYVGAGAMAGVAGHLLVATQRYVSPADVDFHLAALVLLAVVIGGAHSITGAVAAAALVVAVRDHAAIHIPGHGPLLLGVLFVTAVYALPAGAAGAIAHLRTHLPASLAGRR